MLLAMIVSPFSSGRQLCAPRGKKMIGRAASSISFRSTCQTSCFRAPTFRAVLRHVLIVHDEIVENAHHRPIDRDRRFLEQRHARRAVEMGYSQGTVGFLSECTARGCERQRAPYQEHAKISSHSICLLSIQLVILKLP